MTDANSRTDDGRKEASDDLGGLHLANVVDESESSLYPPETARVYVGPPDPDGYYHVVAFDAAGNEVFGSTRAEHRVRGALEGGPGYDVVTQPRSTDDERPGSSTKRLGEAIKQIEIVREDVDDPALLAELDEDRHSLESVVEQLEDEADV